MSTCQCSMAISVLGDGCRYCQPQTYIEHLLETLEGARAVPVSEAKAHDTVGEVVGWYRLDRPYEMTSYPSVCATWHKLGAPVAPLYAAPAAPAADAWLVEAIDWLDDFVARCNGDDRGSCDSVNIIRAALAANRAQGDSHDQ